MLEKSLTPAATYRYPDFISDHRPVKVTEAFLVADPPPPIFLNVKNEHFQRGRHTMNV